MGGGRKHKDRVRKEEEEEKERDMRLEQKLDAIMEQVLERLEGEKREIQRLEQKKQQKREEKEKEKKAAKEKRCAKLLKKLKALKAVSAETHKLRQQREYLQESKTVAFEWLKSSSFSETHSSRPREEGGGVQRGKICKICMKARVLCFKGSWYRGWRVIHHDRRGGWTGAHAAEPAGASQT